MSLINLSPIGTLVDNQKIIIISTPKSNSPDSIDLETIEFLKPPYIPFTKKFQNWIQEITQQGYIPLDFRVPEYFKKDRKTIPADFDKEKIIIFPSIIYIKPYQPRKRKTYIMYHPRSLNRWLCDEIEIKFFFSENNNDKILIAVIKNNLDKSNLQ